MESPVLNLEPTIVLQGWLWALVGVGLLALFGLTRRYPAWGLVSVISVAPLYQVRGDLVGLPTSLLELWLLTVVLAVVSRVPVRQWRSWRRVLPERLTVWIGLFLAAGLLAVLAGPDRLDGLGLWRAWFLEPAIWFLAAQTVFRRHDLKPILAGAIGAVIVTAVWGGYLLATGQAVTYDGRFAGPFQSPNFLSLFLGPLLLLLTAWPRRQWWLARTLAIGVGLAMMMAANSRGGQLALAAGALVTLAFLRGRLLKRAGAVLAILAILAAGVYGPRLVSHRDSTYLAARPVLWREAGAMLRDDPLFGAHPGRFQAELKERIKHNRAEELYIGPFSPNAHNLLLTAWTEWGVLTVLALFGLLAAVGRTIIRRFSYWQVVPVGMLTMILVHGLVDTPLLKNDLALVFWTAVLLTGLVPVATNRRVGMSSLARRAEDPSEGFSPSRHSGKNDKGAH